MSGARQDPRPWRNHACPLNPGQVAIAAKMAEDSGAGSVEWHLRACLKDLGLTLAYHPWRQHASRAAIGWLDWSIAGAGGFMVRELKRQGKEPTAAQDAWLEALRGAGVDAGVWKPCCVLSGRVATELASLARPRPRIAA